MAVDKRNGVDLFGCEYVCNIGPIELVPFCELGDFHHDHLHRDSLDPRAFKPCYTPLRQENKKSGLHPQVKQRKTPNGVLEARAAESCFLDGPMIHSECGLV